ncbi:urokinase plasminogen activator surface receptor-like [Megalobrama amblycephala]|uniref:urokinase plasminogen activator surface receptor-like n=1 Tax=Megalobrama amblycephala TaxID=75352 RepID=UPI002013E757|nr:urokinase plasminogen activator surface receptor-like [Megalobrama amblycephala]
MDLQISVFLLFILFTAGHSLKCYECMSLTGSCTGQTEQTCPSGYSQCESSTGITKVGDITSKVQGKGCVPACQSGSINFGLVRTATSCCNTDLCNLQDAPDPSNVPNGKKCYTCDGESCSAILSCSGDEDRCITATETSGSVTATVKGCISKSICDATTAVRNVVSISCCEGNLCNSAQSVSQSFLFLCCSLLSYFLLH